MDLLGVLVIGDAAHTVKANCHHIPFDYGGDYLFFLKGNQPLAQAKASNCSRAPFPPQAQSLDKGHGRIESRKLWVLTVDGATLGLAGAAQVFRIDRQIQTLRQGRVIKTTAESVYGVTSLWLDEASPQRLLERVRDYWAIEIKQHYRRDHTQREDHCLVRHPVTARNLSSCVRPPFFSMNSSGTDPTPKNTSPTGSAKTTAIPRG